MANFVELNEAARMLSVTPDELVEMRSNGDIHGYRDGASWKFKVDEVERVLAERGSGGTDSGSWEESILVSESEEGTGGASSSTVIGEGEDPAASDLTLSDAGSDLSVGAADDGDDVTLAEPGGPDSDVHLVPSSAGDSDVTLVPDPGSDREVDAGSDLRLDGAAGTGELEVSPSSETGVDDEGSDLALSDDDEIVLSGSGSGSDSLRDSGIDLSSPSDSGLSLEADSDISLATPTDSGLSLDEDATLDTGSGSSVSSLDLAEDEDVVALDAAGGETDDQFMLGPTDEMFAEEESDSGSQVIALEDSDAFDDAAMAGTEGQALLAETAGLGDQLDALGGGTGATPALGTAPVGYGVELPEAPYSVFNLIGLGVILIILCVTGIMMTDVVHNMWAWESGHDVSTSISEGITKAVGMTE